MRRENWRIARVAAATAKEEDSKTIVKAQNFQLEKAEAEYEFVVDTQGQVMNYEVTNA